MQRAVAERGQHGLPVTPAAMPRLECPKIALDVLRRGLAGRHYPASFPQLALPIRLGRQPCRHPGVQAGAAIRFAHPHLSAERLPTRGPARTLSGPLRRRAARRLDRPFVVVLVHEHNRSIRSTRLCYSVMWAMSWTWDAGDLATNPCRPSSMVPWLWSGGGGRCSGRRECGVKLAGRRS